MNAYMILKQSTEALTVAHKEYNLYGDGLFFSLYNFAVTIEYGPMGLTIPEWTKPGGSRPTLFEVIQMVSVLPKHQMSATLNLLHKDLYAIVMRDGYGGTNGELL